MSGVLYLSDLDGTLLGEGGEVSERTRKGLTNLLEQGALITVASARSYFSIRNLFGDLPFRLPIIEFNGAFITDYSTGRHLQINSLGRELGEDLFERILRAGQRPFVCSYNGSEDCLHYDELINPGRAWYEERRRKANDSRLRRTLDLKKTMAEDVVSLTVMDNSEEKIRALHAEIASAFGDRLQTYCYENEYSKGTFWLTIHHENASKHIAMKSLRDEYAPGAELVAIGDNVNDLLMLKHADRGVAVENAVTELHDVAHTVIGHHTADAVIDFLERDFATSRAR